MFFHCFNICQNVIYVDVHNIIESFLENIVPKKITTYSYKGPNFFKCTKFYQSVIFYVFIYMVFILPFMGHKVNYIDGI
jgi:hypothetical protein